MGNIRRDFFFPSALYKQNYSESKLVCKNGMVKETNATVQHRLYQSIGTSIYNFLQFHLCLFYSESNLVQREQPLEKSEYNSALVPSNDVSTNHNPSRGILNIFKPVSPNRSYITPPNS